MSAMLGSEKRISIHVITHLAALVAVACLSPTPIPARICVDIDAAGTPHDGTTWEHAHTSIQAAIDSVAATPEQIWVAEGIYPEGIRLVSGVEIYGGFAGGESSLGERDIEGNPTFIIPISPDNHTEPGHVVDMRGADATHPMTGTRLDGLILAGGSTNGSGEESNGGGVIAWYADSSNVIDRCKIVGNEASSQAGGIRAVLSEITIANSFISGNSAPLGGAAMTLTFSPVTLVNCVISGNLGWGDVILCDESHPSIINCTIADNGRRDPTSNGYGALWLNGGSHPVIRNTLFENNDPGAIQEDDAGDSPGVLEHCLFHANTQFDYLAWDRVNNGAEEINAHVANAHGNVDEDPLRVARVLGHWTQSPAIAPPARNLLVDSHATFEAGELVGRIMAVRGDRRIQAVVTANSDVSVEFAGSLAWVTVSGEAYSLVDDHLLFGSGAIDRGTPVGAPSADREGHPRPHDVPGLGADSPSPEIYDIGPFEFQSALTAAPSSLDFGARTVGSGPSEDQRVRLLNLNASTLDFTGAGVQIIGASSPEFSLTDVLDLTPLSPGETRDLLVAFDPSSGGTHSAELQITTDDPTTPSLVVPLAGTGLVPGISVAPVSVEFGLWDVDAGPAAPHAVTVSNTGITDLNVLAVTLGGADSAEFAIAADTGQSVLSPGASREIEITFDPSSVGAKAATLAIVSDDAAEPLVSVLLSGTGIGKEVNVAPPSLDFGDRDIDAFISEPQGVDIQNVGTVNLTVGFALTGPDADEFILVFDSGPSGPLPPGRTRRVEMVFNPNTVGVKGAFFTVTSDDTDRPVTDVPLGGRGIDQEIAVTPVSVAFGFQDIDDDAQAQAVTILNEGTANLSITSVLLSGDGPPEFTTESDTHQTTLAPGASREVVVGFEPETLDVFTANLVITSDDTDEPTVWVPLSGIGYQPTSDLVEMLLGLQALPASLERCDVNGDGILDAADVVGNVNMVNSP
jgi:hypothetical protein